MRRLRPRSTATPVPDPAETSQIDRHGGSSAAKTPWAPPSIQRRPEASKQPPVQNHIRERRSPSLGPLLVFRRAPFQRIAPRRCPPPFQAVVPPQPEPRTNLYVQERGTLTLSDGRGRTCPELAEGLGCTHRNAVRGLPVEVSTPAGTVGRNRIQAAPFFTLSEGRGRCRPRQSVRGLPRTHPPTTLPPRCTPYARRPAFPLAGEKGAKPLTHPSPGRDLPSRSVTQV